MIVIGLTGGVASGKTAISKHLESRGAKVLCADSVSREITAKSGKAYDAIVKAFGQDYLLPGGELDRRKLRELIFGGASARQKLNSITHPIIRVEFEEKLSALRAENTPVAIIDVPLLIEAGMQDLCSEIWVVDAPAKVRIERLISRDNVSRDIALSMLDGQISDSERKSFADHIIENDDSIDKTLRQADILYSAALEREFFNG